MRTSENVARNIFVESAKLFHETGAVRSKNTREHSDGSRNLNERRTRRFPLPQSSESIALTINLEGDGGVTSIESAFSKDGTSRLLQFRVFPLKLNV